MAGDSPFKSRYAQACDEITTKQQDHRPMLLTNALTCLRKFPRGGDAVPPYPVDGGTITTLKIFNL